ncbi:Grx4 family monothiol glutaredoxin [Candidatus Hepatincola sp. Av]
MSVSINYIQQVLQEKFPQAKIEVTDTVGDGNHIEVAMIDDIFIGKSKLERHKLVYDALGSIVGNEIHALALETKTLSEDTPTYQPNTTTPKTVELTNDILKKIDMAVHKYNVVLFMKGTKDMPMCGFSATTVGILQNLNVDFLDVDVMANYEIRENIKVYSNWPTIPQLYIKGNFIGGCDIIKEMYLNQELQQLLTANNITFKPNV